MRAGEMRRMLVLCLLAVWVTLPVAAFAADDPAAPAIDPQTDKVVHLVADHYKKLNSFQVAAKQSLRYEVQGATQNMVSQYSAAMKRPNKLAVVLKDGELGGTAVADGENLFLSFPAIHQYTQEKAPAKLGDWQIDEQIANALAGPEGVGVLTIVKSLVADDPYGEMMSGVTSGKYIGTEDVDGVSCHRMRFTQEAFDWDLWVQAAGDPTIRRITPDLARMVAQVKQQAGDQARDLKLDFSIAFEPWQSNPELADAVFKFEPTAGDKKVTSFGDEQDAHPLEGMPAPALSLASLTGEKVSIRDLEGKSIVILDFWATWCGPCVAALPMLSEVAQAYKDRGVVVYAVNIREDKETIETFLKEHKLNINVLMDTTGEAADRFGIQSIPQTIFIGKDGVVHKVHVGYSKDLKQVYSAELDEMLAGAPQAEKQ